MGYAPDWNKGSMKKAGATPVKHGVVSRELFHNSNSVQRLADGGGVMGDMSGADMKYEPMPKTDELNIKGQRVGKYDGNDEIVKYRMNMTEGVGGKSLRYKDNPDMMAEKPMPENRPYDSIEAILDDKSSGKSDSMNVMKIIDGAKRGGEKVRAVTKPKMPPYDPSDTARGMGGFDARNLDMPERMANFTARGDYVSATDVAASDFMKRSAKAKQRANKPK